MENLKYGQGVSKNLSAVRKAAEDDEICGRLFPSNPDFEFWNFTLPELEDVLWQIALEKGVDPAKRLILSRAIQGSMNARELEKSVNRAMPELRHFKKDKDWGRRLMEFAQQHPISEKGIVRPILSTVTEAFRFLRLCDYKSTREEFSVDPITGECVARNKKLSSL